MPRTKGQWLDDRYEHADWLLLLSGTPESLRYMENDGFRLLDLGKPKARAWALETIAKEIDATGIAIYRQDFNADYYSLTDWSDDPKQCLAFQFHDPASGEGIVQAFGPIVSSS